MDLPSNKKLLINKENHCMFDQIMNCQFECYYHPGQAINQFCVNQPCLLPLCTQCTSIHLQDHQNAGSLPHLIPFSQATRSTLTYLADSIHRLQAILKSNLSQDGTEQCVKSKVDQLEQARRICLSKINSHFDKLVSTINTKDQSSQTRTELRREIQKQLQFLKEAYRKVQNCQLVKYVILRYSKDEMFSTQHIQKKIHSLTIDQYDIEVTPECLDRMLQEYISIKKTEPISFQQQNKREHLTNMQKRGPIVQTRQRKSLFQQVQQHMKVTSPRQTLHKAKCQQPYLQPYSGLPNISDSAMSNFIPLNQLRQNSHTENHIPQSHLVSAQASAPQQLPPPPQHHWQPFTNGQPIVYPHKPQYQQPQHQETQLQRHQPNYKTQNQYFSKGTVNYNTISSSPISMLPRQYPPQPPHPPQPPRLQPVVSPTNHQPNIRHSQPYFHPIQLKELDQQESKRPSSVELHRPQIASCRPQSNRRQEFTSMQSQNHKLIIGKPIEINWNRQGNFQTFSKLGQERSDLYGGRPSIQAASRKIQFDQTPAPREFKENVHSQYTQRSIESLHQKIERLKLQNQRLRHK